MPIPILLDTFFRLNTLNLYCDKSNGVILDFSTLSGRNLQMVTLKRNPPPPPSGPFSLSFSRSQNSRRLRKFSVFFCVFSKNLGATVQWMTKFVPVRKKPILTPPAKTPLEHLPEGLPPVQHQRTFELTEEIETGFTSVTK